MSLFRGPEEQAIRSKLLIFQKGSKKQQMETEPTLSESVESNLPYFEAGRRCSQRGRHAFVTNRASKLFDVVGHNLSLIACCKAVRPDECMKWYQEDIQFPIYTSLYESNCPWGNSSCSTCSTSIL